MIQSYHIFLLIIFIGCGGASDYHAPQKYGSDDIYISASKGSDTLGKGSSRLPYKTITYALSKKKFLTETLYLAGGEYTITSGEAFPIELPEGISLATYNENNLTVKIKGFGNFSPKDKEVCLVLNGNNRLNNLFISSENNLGILSLKGTNKLLSTILKKNKTALSLLESSYISLESVTIEENSNGVEVNNNATLKLLDSIVQKNEVGVMVTDKGYIDSRSENSKIIANSQCDFFTNGSRNLYLQGISWDKNSLDFTIKDSCIDGKNIVNQADGRISYQPLPVSTFQPLPIINQEREESNQSGFVPENNSSSDSNEKNNTSSSSDRNTTVSSSNGNDTILNRNREAILLFNVKNEINILYPAYGDFLSSTEPNIRWEKTVNDKYIMVCIWKKLPLIQNNEIQNPKDIFWYWHTGMEGGVGRVAYENGAKAFNGEIETTSPLAPESLEKGRAYYLSIWEWDKKGLNIISSSRISVFYTRE